MKKFFSAFLVAAALFVAGQASAATPAQLYFSGPHQVALGQTFTVSIVVGGAIDIDTTRLNGTYSQDLLDWRNAAPGSILPNISPATFVNATNGTFSQGVFGFNGTVNGTSQLLTITFKALKVGTATIQLADSSQIYSAGEPQTRSVGKIDIVIGPPSKTVLPEQPQPLPLSVPPGTTAIMLFSNSHPDPSKWYQSPSVDVGWMSIGKPSASFLVGFDQLPQGPATTVANKSSAHFTATADGTWYVHLIIVHPDGTRDRADLQINYDHTPPAPIAPVVDQTLVRSDIPNAVRFATRDDTSGIDHYDVWIDGVRVTSTSLLVYPLINQAVGTHQVTVTAFDRAGNSSTGYTEFTIIGINGFEAALNQLRKPIPDWMLWILVLAMPFLVIYWAILKRRRRKEEINKKIKRPGRRRKTID